MKRRGALVVMLLLAGCARPVAAPDGGAHPTIVSLNPCTDAILAEVADPDQMLAISHYSQDPRATSMDLAVAKRYRVTGGTVEEILQLKPDIVVASRFLPPAAHNGLRDLGIRVETFGIASTIQDNAAQVHRLAALAGYPERGERLVQRIDSALAKLGRSGGKFQDKPAGKPIIPAVLWQPDGIVPGQASLISHLLSTAGFANYSAERGMGQADYMSLERLLADPPRLLLVAGQERSQTHPALAALPDLQREAFDPMLLYCGGPTIIKAAQRLGAIKAQIR